jgi:nitrile hydratase accessory protein
MIDAEGSAVRQLAAGFDRGTEAPVFRSPWEAHTFAIVVMLQERGLFTWREWADALAARITAAQREGDAGRGDTYYVHWLHVVEDFVQARGASSSAELARWREAWQRAIDRTPHGQPIALQPADFESP